MRAIIRSKRPQQTPIAASLASGRGFAVKTTAAREESAPDIQGIAARVPQCAMIRSKRPQQTPIAASLASGRGFAVKTTAAREVPAPDAREIVTRVSRCAMIRILPIFAARLGLSADRAAERPQYAFVRRACGGVRFQCIPASKNRALHPTQDEARDLF